jgi:glucose/arabinose dehydrogenase
MPLAPPPVRVNKLTEGFAFGVKMTFLSDGRLLITEKETGRVRLVTAAFALEPQPILDVAVNYAGERGLLGIAAHPDFACNGYVYIAYVASATPQDTTELKGVSGIRVARFRLAGTVADGPLQAPITLPARPGPYHNGGCLLFGPDGKLYVSLGELNRHANLNSQVTGKPQGKILRYNDDGSIPPDNPFGAGNPIYIYGARNVFGFAFDSQGTGMFVSDNGPSGYNRLIKAAPGDNLGWPLIWGTVDTWYKALPLGGSGKDFGRPFGRVFVSMWCPLPYKLCPMTSMARPCMGVCL